MEGRGRLIVGWIPTNEIRYLLRKTFIHQRIDKLKKEGKDTKSILRLVVAIPSNQYGVRRILGWIRTGWNGVWVGWIPKR